MKGRSRCLALSALCVLPAGCEEGQGSRRNAGSGDVGVDVDVDGGGRLFDDHTAPRFDDVPSLLAYLAEAPGRAQTKFLGTEFDDPTSREMRYFDGRFYHLHDEWYWFRLLNGQRIPGIDVEPVEGLSFDTVEEIREWARGRPDLPLDLRWVGGDRLYSPKFYTLALDRPRGLAAGGLLHVEARGERPEIWAFELEFSDKVTHAELIIFFQMLEATLPPEIGAQVVWVPRSQHQRDLAAEMEREDLAYADRVISYRDMAVPGEVEVYNEGISAGRLRFFRLGEAGMDATGPNDVVVLEEVPDFLPAASALLTSVPQTPLAHVNLLARNRGIPNAYRGAITDDPYLDQLARSYRTVLVHAQLPDQLTIRTLSRGQYDEWLRLRRRPEVALPRVELEGAPLTLALDELDIAERPTLVPLIGGKSAGLLTMGHLFDQPDAAVSAPHRPLAITIRPYVEHMAPLSLRVSAMLREFEESSNAPLRALIMEGEAGLAARFPAVHVATLVAEVEGRREGDVLRELLAGGGLVRMIRDQAMEPATLAALRAALAQRFAGYATTQGLRFRSSSNVEDIEGFNGAGLYRSSTGFLDAAAQADPKEQKKTVEWALKKTWASYWSAEAFEERELSGIRHASGAMGVLVHPRFDDPLERSNAVLTFTQAPTASTPRWILELNGQAGAMSVANPPPGSNALPEVDVVTRDEPGGELAIQRVRASTEVEPGEVVLSDEALRRVFEEAQRISEVWLAQANAALTPAQAIHSMVLDFELKEMAAGWPALTEGEPLPGRLILKQVRSLDPGTGGVAADVVAGPIPRDILARALRVDLRICSSPDFVVALQTVHTDSALSPDQGYSDDPFVATVDVRLPRGAEELGLPGGFRRVTDHLSLLRVELARAAPEEMAVVVELEPAAAQAAGFDRVTVDATGAWTLGFGEDEAGGTGLQCATAPQHSTPEDYLLSIVGQ